MNPGRKTEERVSTIRIIGGRWRGRRVPLPPGAAVRPTPNRVRETLFNWLAPVIAGARCMDLFAGTGVLGMEALSRGAAETWFVENDRAVAANLAGTLTRLGAGNDRVLVEDAAKFLSGRAIPFDIVFVDPPYGSGGLGNLCTLLAAGWLRPGARVYLEMDRRSDVPELPEGWTVMKDKRAGQVRYALATVA